MFCLKFLQKGVLKQLYQYISPLMSNYLWCMNKKIIYWEQHAQWKIQNLQSIQNVIKFTIKTNIVLFFAEFFSSNNHLLQMHIHKKVVREHI